MKTIKKRNCAPLAFLFSSAFSMLSKVLPLLLPLLLQRLTSTQFAAASTSTSGFGGTDHEVGDNEKIIFFHEILYRVEEPLKDGVWRERGEKLQIDRDFYKEFNEHMEIFLERYEYGKLLKHGEFFGAMVEPHHKQAHGLFHFLYQPLDWGTFVQNACWARRHVNAHMFVYAFTLAALQRQLHHGMLMPKIYESMPNYFFERTFVQSAKQFGVSGGENDSSLETNASIWQWWKFIKPYDQSWRPHYLVNASQAQNDELNGTTTTATHFEIWWRPVDYTRDLKIMNDHAKLSYFTEDVDWNAHWYNLNLNYAFFIRGKDLFWRNETRRGEFWMYSLQQLMTRYEFERLSNGLDETHAFEWHKIINDGYDPQLEEFDGTEYSSRDNNFEPKTSLNNYAILTESRDALERINEIINNGYFLFKNYTLIDLLQNESIEIISDLLQCNADALHGNYETHWYLTALLYLSGGSDRKNNTVQPAVLLNYETMLRDPLYYIFHKRIVAVFQRFRAKLRPYKSEELSVPGLQIASAHVGELETSFELFDFDVSNLQRSISNQSNANRILLARQMRLTHKPFDFNLTIYADRPMTVMLRVFLAPTRDVLLDANRNNFLELHKILVRLEAGENLKTFNYAKYFGTVRRKNLNFQAKKYLDALTTNRTIGMYDSTTDALQFCSLNTRLLLPRGTTTGLPMQMFFILNNLADSEENQHSWWKFCSHIPKGKAFGFPFDRPITDERNFKHSNMFWKNVKIYHRDAFFREN